MKLQKNINLARFTTLKIGGPALYFIEVKKTKELKEAIGWAKKKGIHFLVIGSGSNLLVASDGFKGLIIKNAVEEMSVEGSTITTSAGYLLQNFVNTANKRGLAGVEKLTGIPGTVGAAIYGNAGAYGQTISDCLLQVLVYNGEYQIELAKKNCGFDYRHSSFKENNLTILIASFQLTKGNPAKLGETSKEILELRLQKYPEGLKSPGSFFKNVPAATISKQALVKIPKDKIIFGKISAGYLLETVGAKGATLGGAKIAEYHGNLFLNAGGASAEDFFKLAKEYKDKVREKFSIELESEVQLIGFDKKL